MSESEIPDAAITSQPPNATFGPLGLASISPAMSRPATLFGFVPRPVGSTGNRNLGDSDTSCVSRCFRGNMCMFCKDLSGSRKLCSMLPDFVQGKRVLMQLNRQGSCRAESLSYRLDSLSGNGFPPPSHRVVCYPKFLNLSFWISSHPDSSDSTLPISQDNL